MPIVRCSNNKIDQRLKEFNFIIETKTRYKCRSRVSHALILVSQVAIMFKVFSLLLLFTEKISANNFTCLNGSFIVASEICDGIANCADSSDERRELCSPIICQADQFKCYYGACISRREFCNKHADCIDGSDEFNCGKSNESCE